MRDFLNRVYFGVKVGLALYFGAVVYPYLAFRWMNAHTAYYYPDWAYWLITLSLAPICAYGLLRLSQLRFGMMALIASIVVANFWNEATLGALYQKSRRVSLHEKFATGAKRLAVSTASFEVYSTPERLRPAIAAIEENRSVSIVQESAGGQTLEVLLDDGRRGYIFPGDQFFQISREEFEAL